MPVAVVADALSEAELAAESALLQQCPPPLLLEDDLHPIRDHHISRPAWSVLLKLRGAGGVAKGCKKGLEKLLPCLMPWGEKKGGRGAFTLGSVVAAVCSCQSSEWMAAWGAS